MSRIRSLHPGLFTDDRYMALSFAARELLKGVWCEADDQGVFEWRPLTLKARIMPADAVDVGELLGELVAGHFVKRFDINGRGFGAVRNFRRFQRPKKPNAAHVLPGDLRLYVGLSDDSPPPNGVDPAPVPHQGGTSGEKPPQMEDGGGRREDEEEKHTHPPNAELAAEFDELWVLFPRKIDRGHALKAYRAARKRTDAATIRAGVERFADESRGKDARYIAHPGTWLNGERWLDERPTASPTNGAGFTVGIG